MKKLKCTYPNGVEHHLSKGRFYTILEETTTSVLLVDDLDQLGWWSIDRFNRTIFK